MPLFDDEFQSNHIKYGHSYSRMVLFTINLVTTECHDIVQHRITRKLYKIKTYLRNSNNNLHMPYSTV